MRTFDDLSSHEQVKARSKALDELLTLVAEGAIRFNDKLNGDHLQAKIDAAWRKAEQMQTPWFAHEYIMEAVGDELRAMAQCDAEDTTYAAEDDGPIVRLLGTIADGFKVVAA